MHQSALRLPIKRFATLIVLTLSSILIHAQDGPKISALAPMAGRTGAVIMIVGKLFGPVQGSSTVTFNGIAANPTSWSDTAIKVVVPSGATRGNVVVIVNGQPSNGVNFAIKGTAAQ